MSTREQRAEKSVERAKAIAATCLQNEARRKEALAFVSSAYSDLKTVISDAIWEAIRGRADGQAEQRDWDLSYPYELHNVRQKHHDYALEIAPVHKEQIEKIAALKALRDEIRAMPITPKVKAPLVIQPGDKTQSRGHCQCCGREHAVNGTVVKHGYEVKDRGLGGYFSGVCHGHTHRPMQIDRSVTDTSAASLRIEAGKRLERVEQLRSGKAHPASIERGWGQNKKTVPFADATPYEQRDAVRNTIAHEESMARHLSAFADDLQKLADEVHGKALRVVKV